MTAPAARLLVGVLTFRRPDTLAVLLAGLVTQLDGPGYRADVLVVDNDPAGSAQDVVAGAGSERVGYVVEPEPGIVAGRNRALSAALDRGVDALVFVDDDERVEPGWLAALVDLWSSTGAAAVAGPTVWPSDLELPAWVAASGFYRRTRHPTGTIRPSFAAGNVLLDAGWLQRTGLRFDPRFGMTGGEDTFFALSLVAAGGAIRWADGAVTVEDVPAHRRTRKFVLQRTHARAVTWVQADLLLLEAASSPRRTLRRADLILRATVRVGRASGRWTIAAVLRDARARARAELQLTSGRGMLSAVIAALGRRPASAPSSPMYGR